MSRRRAFRPRAKAWQDMQAKRLQFVCTGEHTHRLVVMVEWSRPVAPGRPDLQLMLRDRRPRGRRGRCDKCGAEVPELDENTLRTMLERAEPGRVSRFDISTGRPVT